MYLPATQAVVPSVSPSRHVWPDGHALQAPCAVLSMNLPLGQSTHPPVPFIFPAGHAAQLALSALTTQPGFSLHDDLPTWFCHLPLWQLLHGGNDEVGDDMRAKLSEDGLEARIADRR